MQAESRKSTSLQVVLDTINHASSISFALAIRADCHLTNLGFTWGQRHGNDTSHKTSAVVKQTKMQLRFLQAQIFIV